MSILIKPVITEKATADSELNNRYTFEVDIERIRLKLRKQLRLLMVFQLRKFAQ